MLLITDDVASDSFVSLQSTDICRYCYGHQSPLHLKLVKTADYYIIIQSTFCRYN